MNKKTAWYVMVVICIGMLTLWGCPKKAEISAVPETPREETPAAEATAQPSRMREQRSQKSKKLGSRLSSPKPTAATRVFRFRPIFYP